MGKKLYYVEISGYIASESQDEAKRIAEYRLVAVEGLDIEVSRVHSVDNAWAPGLPYSDDENDERTCAQILEQEEA